jgi:MOSC domain-containing protein YiiM
MYLLHSEIFASIQRSNKKLGKINLKDLGENITTSGTDLLALKKKTKLYFVFKDKTITNAGKYLVVIIAGLRNPYYQIKKFRLKLQKKFIIRDENRNIVSRLTGVINTVKKSGEIKPEIIILIEKPAIHKTLMCV